MENQEFLNAAQESARIAGQILEDWGERFTSREKSPANLVTEADFASEKAIFEFLQTKFPDHRFLGEEGLLHNEGDSPYRWIIDPLDGTSNYVHRFPYYAVSIALERDGELLVGVIFDPTRNEMFTAVAKQGARLNDVPITVSDNSDLESAMCMASLPVKASRDNQAVQRFLHLLERAQSVQRSGSAALNLCSVACGRVDSFWSTSLKPWDMAAGVLIVREAGGKVTTCLNGPFHVEEADLLATNGTALHGQLTEQFQHVQ